MQNWTTQFSREANNELNAMKKKLDDDLNVKKKVKKCLEL